MVVLENVSPGEEIANNYGPRNNEQCTFCDHRRRVVLINIADIY